MPNTFPLNFCLRLKARLSTDGSSAGNSDAKLLKAFSKIKVWMASDTFVYEMLPAGVAQLAADCEEWGFLRCTAQ